MNRWTNSLSTWKRWQTMADYYEPIEENLMNKITPCLWFDQNAEAAVDFYVSVFKHSRIISITRYGTAGSTVSGRPEGSIMTIAFEIEGQEFVALNGGPAFTFTPAISFVVNCQTQQEVDEYWEKLSEDGDANAQQCGWLMDKFGVSWQIVPAGLNRLLQDPDPEKSERVMSALLQMKKIDIYTLEQAYRT